MSLLNCQNASFGYDSTPVLTSVNFEVEPGDYLCIVGENGSGKSTLIKGLLRLKRPLSGTVQTGNGLKVNEIGYLPQQSEAQRNFPASVFEVVLSGRLNSSAFKPFYSSADKRDAMEKLELMGMADLKNHCYHDLSGGQQQRVLLARALCATKKLILLDEPVAGLDPLVTNDMYHLIKRINTDYGITVIMVSHDIAAAVKYATHILQLGHKQLFFGTADSYVKSSYGKMFLGGEENV